MDQGVYLLTVEKSGGLWTITKKTCWEWFTGICLAVSNRIIYSFSNRGKKLL